jgi:O-succinylbenzoic acid--CoA ligase
VSSTTRKTLVAIATPRATTKAALEFCFENNYCATVIDTRLTPKQQSEQLKRLEPDFVMETIGDLSSTSLESSLAPLEDNDALVIETSGSTGAPKQVVHTLSSLEASAVATGRALQVTADDQWLACLPFAHIGGLSVLLRSIFTDCEVTISAGSSTEAIELSSEYTTLVSLVNRQLRTLPQDIAAGFRRILVGGGPAPELPSNAVATYGMTETGSGIYYLGETFTGLVDGAELQITESGEVQVRGPMLFRTYRNLLLEFGDWFSTGDLGSLQDGQLSITGRQSLLIRTGGEDVSPEILEKRLTEHPETAEALVTSRPSAEWGSEVIALVVGQSDNTPTEADLKNWILEELPAWYSPKSLAWTNGLPRLANGKLDRQSASQLIQD